MPYGTIRTVSPPIKRDFSHGRTGWIRGWHAIVFERNSSGNASMGALSPLPIPTSSCPPPCHEARGLARSPTSKANRSSMPTLARDISPRIVSAACPCACPYLVSADRIHEGRGVDVTPRDCLVSSIGIVSSRTHNILPSVNGAIPRRSISQCPLQLWISL